MCFSASASFIAGASLSAVGGTTLIKTERRAEIPFAMIPLLFGIQQITEGMIWLTFRVDAPLLKMTMIFVYSLFSHVLWPIFIPFSIVLLETGPWRKKTISALQLVGIAVGLYLLYFILKFPVTAEVVGKHIVYDSPHFYIFVVMVFYLAATCASCLLSSYKMINLFGALLLLSFISAYRIHIASLVSVWCFFAAILSLIVYLYFKANNLKTPVVFVWVKNLAKTAETETGSRKYLYIGLVVPAGAKPEGKSGGCCG